MVRLHEAAHRQTARMDPVVDSEKGIEVSVGAPDVQVPAMAAGGEKEVLVPDLPIDTGVVAANNNRGQKKWLAYWLLVVAASLIVPEVAAKDGQLFPPEVAMFTVFLCAICLMFLAMN